MKLGSALQNKTLKGSVKVHGYAKDNLPFNEEQLLHEANTREANAKLNWSEVGTRVSLTSVNHRQVVKST